MRLGLGLKLGCDNIHYYFFELVMNLPFISSLHIFFTYVSNEEHKRYFLLIIRFTVTSKYELKGKTPFYFEWNMIVFLKNLISSKSSNSFFVVDLLSELSLLLEKKINKWIQIWPYQLEWILYFPWFSFHPLKLLIYIVLSNLKDFHEKLNICFTFIF